METSDDDVASDESCDGDDSEEAQSTNVDSVFGRNVRAEERDEDFGGEIEEDDEETDRHS